MGGGGISSEGTLLYKGFECEGSQTHWRIQKEVQGLEQKDQGENRIMVGVEYRDSLQSAEGFVDHFTKDLGFHPKSSDIIKRF